MKFPNIAAIVAVLTAVAVTARRVPKRPELSRVLVLPCEVTKCPENLPVCSIVAPQCPGCPQPYAMCGPKITIQSETSATEKCGVNEEYVVDCHKVCVDMPMDVACGMVASNPNESVRPRCLTWEEHIIEENKGLAVAPQCLTKTCLCKSGYARDTEMGTCKNVDACPIKVPSRCKVDEYDYSPEGDQCEICYEHRFKQACAFAEQWGETVIKSDCVLKNPSQQRRSKRALPPIMVEVCPKFSVCLCKPGFARATDGKCENVKECETGIKPPPPLPPAPEQITCSENEYQPGNGQCMECTELTFDEACEALAKSPETLIEPLCPQERGTPLFPSGNSDCPNPKCVCKAGYARDSDTGKCRGVDECPQQPAVPVCKDANEILKTLKCEYCTDSQFDLACQFMSKYPDDFNEMKPMCFPTPIVGGNNTCPEEYKCLCKNGYARDTNTNKCRSTDDCPAGAAVPMTTATPTVSQQPISCSENEYQPNNGQCIECTEPTFDVACKALAKFPETLIEPICPQELGGTPLIPSGDSDCPNPKCLCKAGYARDSDTGKCRGVDECPQQPPVPVCEDANEILKTLKCEYCTDSQFDLACQFMSKYPDHFTEMKPMCLPKNIIGSNGTCPEEYKCLCKNGYARDTSTKKCRNKNECPSAPTCTTNETLTSSCEQCKDIDFKRACAMVQWGAGTHVQPLCQNTIIPHGNSVQNTADCSKTSSCLCQKGYGRDLASGKCISTKDCERGDIKQTTKCGVNETQIDACKECVEMDFVTACMWDNFDLHDEIKTLCLEKTSGTSSDTDCSLETKCVCKDLYGRDADTNQCRSIDECRNEHDCDSEQPKCGANEQLGSDYLVPCNQLCEDHTCDSLVYFNGQVDVPQGPLCGRRVKRESQPVGDCPEMSVCFCIPGYVRHNLECIDARRCPAPNKRGSRSNAKGKRGGKKE